MYTLSFTLKQHTPIIHFQPDQYDRYGATLRATEVKPKLDKFILFKLGNGNYKTGLEEARKKQWITGVDAKIAFTYSMKFIALGKTPNISGPIEREYRGKNNFKRTDKFPCFFGLMGEANTNSKEFIFHDKINLIITSPYKSLTDYISPFIAEFFACHCFGNRQGKGFGSFTLPDFEIDISDYYSYWFDINLTDIPPEKYNYDFERSDSFRRQYQLFYKINLFYSTLRSGINQMGGGPKIYFKSLLFLYFQSLRIQWDKKTIKEKFYFDELKRQKSIHSNSDILDFSSSEPNKKLVRDLFGLATDSQWKDYPFKGKTDTIKKEHLNRNKEPKIERFKSPLLFKPVEISVHQYRVFFRIDNTNTASFLDKEFSISIDKTNKRFSLKTPKEFDYVEFLNFAFKTDVKSHVQFKEGTRHSDDREFLVGAFNQIRNNTRHPL